MVICVVKLIYTQTISVHRNQTTYLLVTSEGMKAVRGWHWYYCHQQLENSWKLLEFIFEFPVKQTSIFITAD